MLVVWKLDRLGRTLAHLVNIVQDLSARGVGLRVLTGQGAQIDTTTAAGRLVFGIFAALAEFERELIRERTLAPSLRSSNATTSAGASKSWRIARHSKRASNTSYAMPRSANVCPRNRVRYKCCSPHPAPTRAKPFRIQVFEVPVSCPCRK